MTPYYQDDSVVIYHGDCREILPDLPHADVAIVDPPYGETSLPWDAPVSGWAGLLPTRSMWCFGSMRFFMSQRFEGWQLAQDLVWEKHNGSIFHADRFRRVHEHVVQFYRGDWGSLYKAPPTTPEAVSRIIRRRKQRPPHTGHIDSAPYASEDGGPLLMRSVVYVRSEHGRAQHPTQKPLGILEPLVLYSCPPAGLVLDPFAGSGSSLLAAKNLGRRSIGIEIEERYCEIAATRCSQGVLPLSESAAL